MRNSKSQRAGFSLIELMVTVAIIGLLANIALPRYQKFRARARQTEAKSMLSAIFTAEKSFFAEHQSYSWDLASIGYMAEGFYVDNTQKVRGRDDRKNHYGATTFPDAGVVPLTTLGVAMIDPTAFPGDFYPPPQSTCWQVNDDGVTSGDVALGNSSAGVSDDTFEIRVLGCPKENIPQGVAYRNLVDRWGVTHERIFKNHNDGT